MGKQCVLLSQEAAIYLSTFLRIYFFPRRRRRQPISCGRWLRLKWTSETRPMHGNVCERVSGRRRRTLLFISFGCLKKEFSAGWISGGRVSLTKSGLNLMENKESHLMHAHLFLRPNIYIFFKSKLGSFSPALFQLLCFIKSKPQQQQNVFYKMTVFPLTPRSLIVFIGWRRD